jgi:DNA-binding HxlR family transcriptional regulator
MANAPADRRPCAVADALEVIGERWSLLIVRELLFANRRFAGIVSRTGGPSDVISTRLKRLVAEGIIETRPYSDHPPRNEYFLTDKGEALAPVLMAIQEWGLTHVDGEEDRVDLLPHGDHDLRPVSHFSCQTCGEIVRDGRDIHAAA